MTRNSAPRKSPNGAGGMMYPTRCSVCMSATAFVLLLCAPSAFGNGREVFVVDSRDDRGKLLRFTVARDWIGPDTVYTRPTAPPAGLPHLASIAFTSDGQAFIVSGMDGNIYKLVANLRGGHDEEHVYEHSGQVRHVGFGRDVEVLYFSVVPTPQSSLSRPDGQIYSLNLRTRVARLFYTVRQQDVGFDWSGTFAMDGNTVYLSSNNPPTIYKVEDSSPRPVYQSQDKIGAMTFARPSDLYYTNGGSRVFRLQNFRQHSMVREASGRELKGLAFAPHLSRGQCFVSGTIRGPAESLGLFHPVVVGPHHGLSRGDWAAGARVAPDGRFRINNLPKGKYWLRLDTRGDTWLSPVPAVRTFTCDGRPITQMDFQIGSSTGAKPAECSLKPDGGNSKANFDRYYYDGSKCRMFVWGGLGGVVPFETLEECRVACERQ